MAVIIAKGFSLLINIITVPGLIFSIHVHHSTGFPIILNDIVAHVHVLQACKQS